MEWTRRRRENTRGKMEMKKEMAILPIVEMEMVEMAEMEMVWQMVEMVEI